MDILFESRVAHNAALGSTALWQFTRAYFDSQEQRSGPSLPLLMLVLPVVFHRRTAIKLQNMKSASGFAKALLDDPELPVGLQARLEGFSDASFAAIRLSVSAGLLECDPDRPWPRYTPSRKTLPADLRPVDDDTRAIVGAAKRLGWWFAHEDLVSICSLLHVKF